MSVVSATGALTGVEDAERLPVGKASAEFFDALGVALPERHKSGNMLRIGAPGPFLNVLRPEVETYDFAAKLLCEEDSACAFPARYVDRRCTAGFSTGFLASLRLCAVLISAICVSACGKLPV